MVPRRSPKGFVMFEHGEGFVLRHQSRRYFRSDLIHFGQRVSYADGSYTVVYELVSNPLSAILIATRGPWERHLASSDWAMVADQFEIVPGPGCACCGERWGTMWGDADQLRCDKHKDRNPCAIEGCKRTRAANGHLSSEMHLCGEHWRRYCPPGSMARRAINRMFRIAKKAGYGRNERWSRDLERQYWRLWSAILRRARRRAEGGHLDEAEINRLMGWD